MSIISYSNEASFNTFKHLDIRIDEDPGIVWVYMKPSPRPCFNPELLSEIRKFQSTLERYKGKLPHNGKLVSIHYHVFDSRFEDVFSLGGDLHRFFHYIRARDERGMLQYARSCLDGLYPVFVGFNLPITTISLVRGQALGGGFELALASRVLIAEQRSVMGLPEIMFNLFPGMGAYNFLCQRISPSEAEKLILSGNTYTAQQLHEKGLVDVVAPDGEGEAAVYEYIRKCERHRLGYLAMGRVKQRTHPISYDELMDICTIWVETAMQLKDKDLRIMERLVNAQNRRNTELDSEVVSA